MSARQLIGPALAGSAVGLVAIVGYNCFRNWYLGFSGDPRCVYNFKNYVEMFEPVHGTAKVSCRYDPNFPEDIAREVP